MALYGQSEEPYYQNLRRAAKAAGQSVEDAKQNALELLKDELGK
jgi:hypothetical protein